MTSNVEQKMAGKGICLPALTQPGGAYLSFMRTGNLVFISGQLPRVDGVVTCTGKVGAQVNEEAAKSAARICGLNLLAQLKAACEGDLDRVVRCVRLNGAVNSDPGFVRQPAVIDGASELMVEVFGEAGKHTRVAIGAASLPAGAAVEVDGIFEVSAV